MTGEDRAARWRRHWDSQAASYDRRMDRADRLLFGDSRRWTCAQATGDTLEVAIGTGLNLDRYPANVTLTGIDWSPAMLDLARTRADRLGRAVDLRQADARSMPFPDAAFDTVVCTFSLCAIPDHALAIAEMRRVLRPGGLLLLADHVASTVLAIRLAQRLVETFTVPLGGEHLLRRPLDDVKDAGFTIVRTERFKAGLVERVAARAPAG
ncbi:class I SAM-dependent methyltransferase [Actinokineospora sp.]|uniref:class I SAM-dependent methyltransferase n=1 Tax=Actinokineospora sp. TaxID=1872133 RepID=UPI004037EDC5